jgi:hypothetical protein
MFKIIGSKQLLELIKEQNKRIIALEERINQLDAEMHPKTF